MYPPCHFPSISMFYSIVSHLLPPQTSEVVDELVEACESLIHEGANSVPVYPSIEAIDELMDMVGLEEVKQQFMNQVLRFLKKQRGKKFDM